jgi:hypothetical protein
LKTKAISSSLEHSASFTGKSSGRPHKMVKVVPEDNGFQLSILASLHSKGKKNTTPCRDGIKAPLCRLSRKPGRVLYLKIPS